MPRSMTAYARQEKIKDAGKITVEMKSVNHRYADISIRLPRYYLFMEEKIRKYIADRVSRGKIDVFVTIEGQGNQKNVVMVNDGLAKSYLAALKSLAADYGVKDDISVSTMARYTDIFDVEREELDEDEMWQEVEDVLNGLMEQFISMREAEGERLKVDIVSRAEHILDVVREIEAQNPETVKAYQEKLREKIQELLGDRQVEESRLLTEVAIFADKIAIAEEVTRLGSHVDALKELMGSSEPIGRKLDFIVQEMNREINTIGSKCNDIVIAKKVVDVKAEIEKIREQIQNIE